MDCGRENVECPLSTEKLSKLQLSALALGESL